MKKLAISDYYVTTLEHNNKETLTLDINTNISIIENNGRNGE